MTNQGLAAIGWVDYILVVASLAVCVYIGLRKPKKSGGHQPEDANAELQEQTTGGRKLGMLPVAFSIMATVLSGSSLTTSVGEVYKYGVLTALYPMAGMLTKLIVAYSIVPVLRAYPYVSIYEYIEKRYDRSFRLIFSSVFIVSHVIYLGLALYSTTISLTAVTGIPYWIIVFSLGLLCAFYCVIGGLRAIIWTDVFQGGMMFFCILTVIVQAVWASGGFVMIFKNAFETPLHTEVHFPYTEDPIYRYSIWSMIFAGAADTLKSAVVSQAGAQRLLCVDSVKTAARSLIVGGALVTLFKSLATFAGLAIYSNLKNCDPLTVPERSKIKNEEQIFMYAVNKFMSHIPGMQGLAVAGLISATLSTCSSLINAFAVLTLEDFAKPLFPSLATNGHRQLLICKISTIGYALLAIALSFLTPYLGGTTKVLLGLISSLIGPLSGVMILAFFSRRSQSKACKLAFVISLSFVSWIVTGSTIYKKNELRLPGYQHGCVPDNSTDLDIDVFYQESVPNNNYSQASSPVYLTELKNNSSWNTKSEYVFPLYNISFMWFGPISILTTCVLGLVFSYIMGGQKDVDDLFLSPWVTKSWFTTSRKSESRRWIPCFLRDRKSQVIKKEEVLFLEGPV